MQVILKKDLLHGFLEDISLLHGDNSLLGCHRKPLLLASPCCDACPICDFSILCNGAGLGVRLVIVLGAQQQIDAQLRQQGKEPRFVGGYRITDPAALLAAVEASGCSRMEVHPSHAPAVRRVVSQGNNVHCSCSWRACWSARI